ncbi:MAG: hypothetical protein AAF787_05550 [Chloroflexota bacterium]
MRIYNFFTSLLPDSRVDISNPLYHYGSRRHRGSYNPAHPLRSLGAMLLWTVSIPAGMGIIMILLASVTLLLPEYGYSRPRSLLNDVNDYLSVVFIGTAVASLIMDFVVLGVTLYRLIARRTKEIGDLLHMTPLTAYDVTMAQYALARLATWRFAVQLAGVRIAILMIYLFVGAVWHPLLLRESVRQGFRLSVNPVDAALQVGFIGTLFVVMIVEPFWRYRMITALGVTIAVRFRTLFGALAGGAAVLLLLVTLPQLMFVPPVFEWLTFVSSDFAAVVGLTGSAWFVFGWYASIERVALFRAQQVMFREGRD